jgi:hypothetical protein
MRHDQLPVYKVTYDLLLQSFADIRHFPREYKYTLGEKIKLELLELICMLYRVNTSEEKYDHLQQSREHIETIRLLWRISRDMKLISIKKYVVISQYITSISKQLTARQRKSKL